MNSYYMIIVLLFEGVSIIFVLAFRKHVFEIMNREHADCSKSVDSIQDFRKIYTVLKNNKNLSDYERRILSQHLIFTIISIMLFVVFVYLVFVIKR